MTDSPLTRRRVLRSTTGLTVVGLAGCTAGENGDSTNGTATDSHEETATESGHSDGSTASGHHDSDGHEDSHSHEDDGHSHDETVGEPTDTAVVKMLSKDGGYHFSPHVVRVTVGGTVTFQNESGSHSTTAYHPDNGQPQLVPDGAAAWDSGILSEQGATFEHTFETEGVYHYYCTPHESMGMISTVIVGEPDAHGQPALETSLADKSETVRTKIANLNEQVNEILGHTH
ncbi:hypothetical protein GL213_02110 [Halogeometricum borinquense]|uniref:Blue (type 1) copper domain-containing protein n=1 Tax=Halogeometricum borinquense TaxID=60847 RepID=A0A6C0UNH2_9EURY|nr:plastocyanin/azurin family copper-binding protein [Halogeometricum borinquense]QIB76133.1 hypothetical protein G3I44_18790 [Halogeometricum borinquense]QIQ75431.1 hypothetical protein GL213_02110 [Halogeometricum borinquense]